MSTLAIPYTFTPGTTAQSGQVNANFAAVVTAVNNIDNTNVGSLGFYASQLKPLSTAQATFGGPFGYTFYPGASGQVPLTVSGASGQAVDIFDVTLTSGGTKALAVSSTGALLVNPNAAAVIPLSITGASGQTADLFDVFSSTPTKLVSVDKSGNLSVNAYIVSGANGNVPTNIVSGELGTATGTSQGRLRGGGSVSTGSWDWNVNNSSAWSSTNITAGGYADIYGGAYHNASDASLKENVAPITGALSRILELKPSSFDWIADARPDLGFIAQQVREVVPIIVRQDADGLNTLAYHGILTLLVAAFQEYVAAHP